MLQVLKQPRMYLGYAINLTFILLTQLASIIKLALAVQHSLYITGVKLQCMHQKFCLSNPVNSIVTHKQNVVTVIEALF